MLARNLYRIDRRSLKDRRRPYHLSRLTYRGVERRDQKRRSQGERRAGWVRVSKWSSVYLQGLKIGKYLK
jgi:hypothetical protein